MVLVLRLTDFLDMVISVKKVRNLVSGAELTLKATYLINSIDLLSCFRSAVSLHVFNSTHAALHVLIQTAFSCHYRC